MECFQHPGSGSVAVCKTCGKGICRTCAVVTQFSVSCSDSCAKESESIREFFEKLKSMYHMGGTAGFIGGSIFGILFFVIGVSKSIQLQRLDWVPFVLGVLFFALGFFVSNRFKKLGF